MEDSGLPSAAQRMFGSQAPVYATSQVHVRDDSLEIVERLASQAYYRWAMDLGAGAGFTAFAMSRFSRRVLASDITRPMLEETRRLGQERGLTNLRLGQSAAEVLPIISGSLDLVTCRVAGHHFTDFEKALDEIRRALRVGGVLLMADSVAPEDDAVAEWMNRIEERRDFSHVENRKISVLEDMLRARGLDVLQKEHARIYLGFNEWVARTGVPAPEAEALRRDFLGAPPAVREAFQVQSAGDDLSFSWPCLVFRAVKS